MTLDLNEQVWEWAASLPDWQSDLLRRLADVDELDDDERDVVGRMLLAAHGALPASSSVGEPRRLRREHLPRAAAPAGAPRLVCLKDVSGLGAVAPGQRLELGDGLTVIYGANGAGKSSFSKLLKNACRPRTTERVLANVFDETTDVAQTATFVVRTGEDTDAITRGHEDPPSAALRSVSVFDEACADLYIGSGSAIPELIPSELALLSRLAREQSRLRKWCDEQDALRCQGMPVFEGLSERALEELEGGEGGLAELVAFGPMEAARLSQLQGALASVDADDARGEARREQARLDTLATVMDQLGQAEKLLSADHAERLREARERVQRAEEAAMIVNGARERLQLAATTGGASWRQLWQAADALQAESEPEVALADAERCPLCRTELDAGARARFVYFVELANDEAQREVREASRALTQWLDELQRAVIDKRHIERLSLPEDELEALRRYADSCDARAAALAEGRSRVPALAPSPLAMVAARQREASEQQRMRDEASEPACRVALEEERDRLLVRRDLHQRSDDARRFLAERGRAKRIAAAKRAAAPNKITKKQGELAQVAVTGTLAAAFEAEQDALGLRHLRASLFAKASVGETTASLVLDGAKQKARLADVFSTGERRALALAFFLAEVRTAEHGGGIVLDDPVSSLDHERLDHVAHRLVEAAERRQVIVFTHDIRLMLRLEELAEGRPVEQATVFVVRHGDTAGIVSSRKQWVTRNADSRAAYLRNELTRLERWERENALERYEWDCAAFLAHLRRAWERAVEESLFNRAVERFSPAVSTRRLASVRVTQELVAAVAEGMSACSAGLHDQPERFRDRPPTARELAAMVDAYERFRRRCQEVQRELADTSRSHVLEAREGR